MKYVLCFSLFFILGQCKPGQQPGKNYNSLNDFNIVGDANWQLKDGVFTADSGVGFLVTKKPYTDFELNLDFYAATNTNSGVFFRCHSAVKITDTDCYEANIFDNRPDQSGRTGGIPHVAAPAIKIDSEGRWNKYALSVRGKSIKIKLNEKQTVAVEDDRHKNGFIALQFAQGGIKFKNIKLTALR